MLKWLKTIINNANTTMNSEKAKAIRKKLLTYGGIGLGIGIFFIILGFVLFTVAGFSGAHSMSPNITLIIFAVIIFTLGGFLTTFSSFVFYAGFQIVVGGIATKVLDADENKVNRCPNCNDVIAPDELYCSKCGYNLKAKKCSKCNTLNDYSDNYCKNCGNKLD